MGKRSPVKSQERGRRNISRFSMGELAWKIPTDGILLYLFPGNNPRKNICILCRLGFS
jgi:hypothetical protein